MLQVVPYLSDFPFPYYVVVQDTACHGQKASFCEPLRTTGLADPASHFERRDEAVALGSDSGSQFFALMRDIPDGQTLFWTGLSSQPALDTPCQARFGLCN